MAETSRRRPSDNPAMMPTAISADDQPPTEHLLLPNVAVDDVVLRAYELYEERGGGEHSRRPERQQKRSDDELRTHRQELEREWSAMTEKDIVVRAKPDRRRTARVVVTDTDIARRAYELFLAHGCEHGHDLDDWLQAERELR